MAALLIILCHLLSTLPRTKVSLLKFSFFNCSLMYSEAPCTLRSAQFNKGSSTDFPYLPVS